LGGPLAGHRGTLADCRALEQARTDTSIATGLAAMTKDISDAAGTPGSFGTWVGRLLGT
jgi:hypothetical protein